MEQVSVERQQGARSRGRLFRRAPGGTLLVLVLVSILWSALLPPNTALDAVAAPEVLEAERPIACAYLRVAPQGSGVDDGIFVDPGTTLDAPDQAGSSAPSATDTCHDVTAPPLLLDREDEDTTP